MVLSAGAIAGIAIAGVIVAGLTIWVIYVIVKKRRRNAEYLERCGQLWQKYGRNSEGSQVVAQFPYADPSYVSTPVPGQQFTARELNPGTSEGILSLRKKNKDSDEDSERRPFVSMHTPLDPEDINPKHYSYGTDDKAHLGHEEEEDDLQLHPPQIFFSMEYETATKTLKVFIDQAKHLQPHSNTKICDPYCVVTILPGEQQKETSQIQRNTLDPLFQETFSFSISQEALKESSLQIMFFAYDQYSQDQNLGVVEQQLDSIKFDSKVEMWRKIKSTPSEQELNRAGDLLVRLGYLASAEKLTIVLLKVRSLKEVGLEGEKTPPDPYVRVAITHDGNLLKKKKTSTKKKTCNPTFNQAINFAVPLHLLPQIEIQFDVVHEDEGKLARSERKEIIGSLEISSHSTGEEKDHWKDLMSNKPLARWHTLVIRQGDINPDTDEQQREDTLSRTKSHSNTT